MIISSGSCTAGTPHPTGREKLRRLKKTAKNIFNWNPAHAAPKCSGARSDTADRSNTLPARRFRFKLRQRGKRQIQRRSSYLRDSIRELPSYLPGGEKQLTDTFQTFDFKLVIPSRCRQILHCLQVNGEGKLIAEWYKWKPYPKRARPSRRKHRCRSSSPRIGLHPSRSNPPSLRRKLQSAGRTIKA